MGRAALQKPARLAEKLLGIRQHLELSQKALHFAHYNFCRIHKTIRCTPAMEAGLTKTVWTLKDFIGIAI